MIDGPHNPVLGSGFEPAGQQVPSERFCSGGHVLGGLHAPVLASGLEPAGQHLPVLLTTDPGAQHCLVGHAVPAKQSVWH